MDNKKASQDGWLVWVCDQCARVHKTDGVWYRSEEDALLALGNRKGYVGLRSTWLRNFEDVRHGRVR